MTKRLSSCAWLAGLTGELRAELLDHAPQLRGRPAVHLFDNLRRDFAVESLRNGTRDGAQRVGVASERDRLAHRVLEIFRLQEGNDGLPLQELHLQGLRRHRPLARFVEGVPRADVIQPHIQIVAEAMCDLILDRDLRLACARQ